MILPEDQKSVEINTSPSVTSQEPVSTQNTQPATSVFKSNTSSKLILTIAAVLLLVGAVVGGSFYAFNVINYPTKVKSQVENIQTVVESLNRTVTDISKHLAEDDDSSDSESLIRDVQKGKNFVKSAQQDLDTLTQRVSEIKSNNLSNYKKSLEEYLTASQTLIALEKNNVHIIDVYIKPIKDYEGLKLQLSGVSNYLVSDPDKYVSEVNTAIDKENSIIKELESVQPGADLQKLHDGFLKILKTEVDFLKQMKEAVEKRSLENITAAEQKYVENSQADNKDFNRVNDEFKEHVNELTKNVETAKKTLDKDYNDLKTKYKF